MLKVNPLSTLGGGGGFKLGTDEDEDGDDCGEGDDDAINAQPSSLLSFFKAFVSMSLYFSHPFFLSFFFLFLFFFLFSFSFSSFLLS